MASITPRDLTSDSSLHPGGQEGSDCPLLPPRKQPGCSEREQLRWRQCPHLLGGGAGTAPPERSGGAATQGLVSRPAGAWQEREQGRAAHSRGLGTPGASAVRQVRGEGREEVTEEDMAQRP